MSQEFYRNVQALHEEYQKRELHYLSEETKLKSMLLKKEISLPLQECLQKIDKREQQTEETYRNIMKQMEELDKCANMMTFNIEKLQILSNNAETSKLSNWTSNPADLASAYVAPSTSFRNVGLIPYQKQHLVSIETQTEVNMLCEKCNSEIYTSDQLQHSLVSSAYPPSVINFNPNISDNLKTRYLSKPNVSSTPKEKEQSSILQMSVIPTTYDEPSFIAPVERNDLPLESNADKPITDMARSFDLEKTEVLQRNNLIRKEVPEQNRDSVIKSPLTKNLDVTKYVVDTKINTTVSTSPLKEETEKAKNVEFKDSGIVNQTEEVLQKTINFERKEIPDQLNTSVIKTPVIETRDVTNNVDITGISSTNATSQLKQESEKLKNVESEDSIDVSKSDEGSIYHEFDFLEAETPTVSKEVTAQELDASVKNTEQNMPEKNSVSKVSPKDEGMNIPEKSRLDVRGDISDTSGSVTGPPSVHSENLSVGSDSDSLQERETPLKASAAYQALLGNTVIIPPKSKKKESSDSESEDEIEKALATAVRKPSMPLPKVLMQPKEGEKASVPEVDSKPVIQPPKPTVRSKPQSKLSKNTRKVLGLDTSSGSDVELAVKPPEKKIDEDTDEFDFFD